MKVRCILAILLFITMFSGHAPSEAGTAYRYVDEDGVVCFTDNPATIPQDLQGKVDVKNFSRPSPTETVSPGVPETDKTVSRVNSPRVIPAHRNLINYRFDDRLDLATNLLGYDVAIYPQLFGEKIDKARVLSQLEQIAENIRKDMKKSNKNDPKTLLCCMLDRITLSGFSYEDWKFGEKIGFLKHILEGKKTTCFGFSLLCLALGERLGLPLYGVGIPCPKKDNMHLFVRYDDGQERFNVEATNRSRGLRHGDRSYRQGSGAWDSPYFFRNLSKREVVGDYLYYLWWMSKDRQRLELADECARRGWELAPDSWYTNYMMAHTHLRRGEKKQARSYVQKMLDVGYMAPPEFLKQVNIDYPDNRWFK